MGTDPEGAGVADAGLFGGPPALGPLVEAVAAELGAHAAAGARMFATSSFQTNSVVLLDLLDRFAPQVPVYFLNTGYHFPETLRFRRALGERFSLKIIDLFSPVERGQQRDAEGRLLFTSDPDHCCHLNKVLPLDPIIAAHDLWISGIRGSQSSVRQGMGKESVGRGGVRRYHPLHAWDGRTTWAYIEERGLPRHPLEDEGYLSLGCRPCTRRLADEAGPAGLDDRGGRWFGLKKTECGLHLDGAPAGGTT
jgi:phosphoadenosine phosphosulfate reductase